MNEKVQNTIRNLVLNGFEVRYFNKAEEAAEALLKSIDKAESVGFGGSMTVSDMGIYEKLKEQGNPVFWHWKCDAAERKAVLAEAAGARVFLTGSNAVTEDGRLINIDGTGNRLSSLLFGHDRVYVLAGVNKLCKSLDEALIRIKNVAAPQNAVRLDLDTPCRHLGRCMNCSSKQRMCNATLVLDKRPNSQKVIIYLINEDLGY